jgi:hypothetical protein
MRRSYSTQVKRNLTNKQHFQVIRVVQTKELPFQVEVTWYSSDQGGPTLLCEDQIRSFNEFFQVKLSTYLLCRLLKLTVWIRNYILNAASKYRITCMCSTNIEMASSNFISTLILSVFVDKNWKKWLKQLFWIIFFCLGLFSRDVTSRFVVRGGRSFGVGREQLCPDRIRVQQRK